MSEFMLGYRLLTEVQLHGRMTTPYLDIAMIPDREEALAIHRKMARDFEFTAEFRLVEVIR